MAVTRPTTEQLRFTSAKTGEHSLDTYLENAELGDRQLSALVGDLFDSSGVMRSDQWDFKFDTSSSKFQVRVGGSSASYTDITSFFNQRGTFSSSNTYQNFDMVVSVAKDTYIVSGLSAGSTFADEAAFIASSNTTKIVDTSEARQWAIKTDGAVESTNHSAKAWAIGGTGVTDTAAKGAAKEWATETSGTVDGTSFSSKEYAQGTQASTGGSAKDWAQDADQVNGATTNDRSSKAWAQGASMTGATLGGSSKDWAQTTSGTVDGTNYSAKEYAQGTQASTGGSAKNWAQDSDQVNGATTNDRSAKAWAQGASMTGATLGGSSKDWAQTTGGTVDGTDYSSKEYAIGTTVAAGSSKEWATTAEDTAVSGGEFSAKHYSAKSSASATASAGSATTALGHANTASGHANTASGHKDTATTQAGISTTKAGEAAASALAASNSATSASSAQTAAESARDSALSAYDNFDDRYLGEKSSNPSVDNDGNTLVGGTLYFNGTTDKMMVWTGSAWVETYADGSTLLALAGGTMTGAINMNNQNITSANSVTAGDINLTGKILTITGSPDDTFKITTGGGGSTTLQTVDASGAGGHLQFVADGYLRLQSGSTYGEVLLNKGGTNYGEFFTGGSDFNIRANQDDQPMKFNGKDGGTFINALTLDMANNGQANFRTHVNTAWGDDQYIRMYYDDAYHMGLHMEADTRDVILYSKSADGAGDIRFKTGSGPTEKMTLLADGKVGIGTTAPVANFEVHTELNAISGTNVDVSNISQKIHNPQNDTGEAVGIGFGISTGAYNVGGAITFERTDGDSQGKLHFATKGAAGQAADIPIRMTIDTDGDVGIGTTAPTELLHLKSTGKAHILLEADSDNVTETDTASITFSQDGGLVVGRVGYTAGNILEIWNTDDTGRIAFATNNTERMSIAPAGNVGIGNTSPTSTLHVTGDATVDDINLNGKVLTITGDTDDTFTITTGAHGATTLRAIDTAGELGTLTLDADGRIFLDAGDTYGGVYFEKDSTSYAAVYTAGTGVGFHTLIDNGTLNFQGYDSSSTINALQLQMANAGKAIFNAGATFADNVELPDNVRLTLGATADVHNLLELYHDGTNSILRANTAPLWIQTDDTVKITKDNGTEAIANFIGDGAVELYHDASKKFETTATGATITGGLTADSATIDDISLDGKVLTITGDTGDTFTITSGAHGATTLKTIDTAQALGVITLDSDGRIHLDSGDPYGQVTFMHDAANYVAFHKSGNTAYLSTQINDGDFIIRGLDSSSNFFNALTFDMSNAGAATFSGDVTATGNVTAYSMAEAKESIETIINPLELVEKLRGVSFNWKGRDEDRKTMGFVYEEVDAAVPELARSDEDGRGSVMYQNTVAVLVEAVKSLSQRVKELEAK